MEKDKEERGGGDDGSKVSYESFLVTASCGYFFFVFDWHFDQSQDAQLGMIKNINIMTEQEKQLEEEIAAYADNDPLEIERQEKLVQLLKTSANVWIG